MRSKVPWTGCETWHRRRHCLKQPWVGLEKSVRNCEGESIGQFTLTYHINSPKHDPAKSTNEIANGTCSLSGGINTSGMNATYQITMPMKSLVSKCEPSEKKFFMCANPIPERQCVLATKYVSYFSEAIYLESQHQSVLVWLGHPCSRVNKVHRDLTTAVYSVAHQ